MKEVATPGGKVGYKSPPLEHRFKKGLSGNPAGRPRKSRSQVSEARRLQLTDILLEEAMRPIQVRENDQVIELPMIQAVVRSWGVSAVKGDHRAQLALTEMVKQVQAERAQLNLEQFKTAAEYKWSWEKRIAEAKRLGVEVPNPVPHPDEIILDVKTGTARFNGPQSDDEKAAWDQLLEERRASLRKVEALRAEMPKRGKQRAQYEADIAVSRKLADMVGGIIPDEETRRQPGFDLEQWREENGEVQKLRRAFEPKGNRKRNGG